MEVLRGVVVLITVSIIQGSNVFRSDYEYHASAGGWFKFHKVPAKWHDARLMCDFEGAVLASPINVDVTDVLQNIINKIEHLSTGVHTGVHNTISPVVFNSIEGVPLSALPVRTRDMFTEEYSSGPHCARLIPQEGLVAGSCSDALPYICYKNKTAELSMTECGTVDKGYQLSAKTGHCYKFHNYGLPWSLAYLRCIAEGGQLAVINSAVEANVLKELLARYPTGLIKGGYAGGAFLGFHDWNNNNVWRTVNGQTLEEAGYANWGVTQPDSSVQNCGQMFRSGQLDDIGCAKVPFICEKHPNNIMPVPNNV
ncbi:lymphocyte antigen 75 [Manduca sexta]|uniref:C-type lectin domain-containing protein n=1 Tax=Manduca sexta TaxID=7130 RepID=A0A922CEM4_MANSE|nr:lymphocyte antigen 75 [Manduca sexta]KAG6444125.1 hypothetical protein O3G_MSEX003204 [Manduca sexta]